MKYKNNHSIIQAFKSITDKETDIVQTFINIGLNGNIIIESFKKLIEYNEKSISLIAGNRTIFIYGNGLKILSFSKSELQIDGEIEKIELSEVK